MNERRSPGATLDSFERLLERLRTGEAVPNADLARSIAALRECEPPAEDPNKYIPPTDLAARCLREVYWALEALERGESGAAGRFVREAGEYVRLCRQRSRQLDRQSLDERGVTARTSRQ
jgi:hypothetical protein